MELAVKAFDIGKVLVESFSSYRLSRESTAHESVINKISFDLYHEKLSKEICEGIDIDYYSEIVKGIASSMSMPRKIEKELHRGKYMKNKETIEKEFVFNKGEPGKYAYIKVVMIKRDAKTIDLACAIFNLEFKLSKKQIEVGRSGYDILDFFLGTTTKYQDMELTANEENSVEEFFRCKVADSILKEFPQYATPIMK